MPRNRVRPRHRPLSLATIAGIFSLVLPTCTLIRLYNSTSSLYPALYICVISGVTFLFYGYDKMQARNMEWRVRERTLHVLALIGGWPGALAGMHYFQHKTSKSKFQYMFWGIVMGWECVLYAAWRGGSQMI
ncbi:hypothetical protein GQ44DRAFT_225905 [Phaeosphaeriaceae sp. PMI808]|nr:hypothetical protein GQ44DRAFT_225905 [Phaeosphaeriaceae sp. PMI808]